LPSIFDIKNAIEQRVNYQGEEILELSQHQRSIRDKLSRRLKTLKKSYEKLSHQTPTKQSWQRLADDAQLLQTHLHLVKPDNYVLTLTPEQTGLDQDLCLMIDPEKSPGQNLNDRFLEIKKKKRSLDIGSKRLTLLAKDIALADEDLARLRHQILDDTELAEFVRRHSFLDGKQIQSPKQTQGDRLAYRAYKDQNGVIYRVGKGSSDNDVLTKSAKANDFWLHVVGSPGSHIIIPAASLPQKELSSDAKKTAAILAIHYSKRRSDHAGEVYVTQRRFLRKPKQAPTGMWTVDKSESIFVRYDETELKQILDTLSSL
jgi:predicted ribosome quality control (RQC) complex YloA/Tae2 family protein